MSRWTPTSRPRCGEPWEPGRRFDTETLRRAGAGEVVSKGEEVATGSREGPRGTNEALEVYVPLTYGLDHPVGIAESYLPYAPVAAAIAHDKLVLSSALGLTLLVFWLVTARMVSQASRRLRVTASRNDYLARHDVLTGLPNRAYLLEQLEDALAAAAPTRSTVAVLLVDLDRFKEINDTLGHETGDQLLQQVGRRIGDELERIGIAGSSSVARLGATSSRSCCVTSRTVRPRPTSPARSSTPSTCRSRSAASTWRWRRASG